MRITPGGKSHDATAVKRWYEVYFLDETKDLTGDMEHRRWCAAGIGPSCSCYLLAQSVSMMQQRIPGQRVFNGQ
jgi:hypothetical protein